LGKRCCFTSQSCYGIDKSTTPRLVAVGSSFACASTNLDVLVTPSRAQDARWVEVNRENGFFAMPNNLQRFSFHYAVLMYRTSTWLSLGREGTHRYMSNNGAFCAKEAFCNRNLATNKQVQNQKCFKSKGKLIVRACLSVQSCSVNMSSDIPYH
jgi:hypothetical protein